MIDPTQGTQPNDTLPPTQPTPVVPAPNPAIPNPQPSGQPATQGAPTAQPTQPTPAQPAKTVGQKVYDIAQTLSGGPRIQTAIDPSTGAVKRTPVHPSAAHLGLAMALGILSGGIGAPPGQGAEAFQRGVQAGRNDVARNKQADQAQAAQAQADYENTFKNTKLNLERHQMLWNDALLGKGWTEQSISAHKPLMDMIQAASDGGVKGANGEPVIFGVASAQDVPKKQTELSQKYGFKMQLIPFGDVVPLHDPQNPSEPLLLNGVPQSSYQVAFVNPTTKIQLTPELVDRIYDSGVGFHNPDGSKQNIGQGQQVSLLDFADLFSKALQIEHGERLLQLHRDDFRDTLGKDAPELSTDKLSEKVKTDPTLRSAVQAFGQAQLSSNHLEDILDQMLHTNGAAASKIMSFLGITPTMLDQLKDARAAAAAKSKLALKPEKIDSADRANAVIADPNESAGRKQQAADFLKGATSTAAKKAGAEALARVNAETNSGDVEEAARNVVSGDLTNLKDITSMRGGQRTAMFNAIHNEALRQNKNPQDWSPAALKTKSDMYEDYRQGKTSNNIAAFDAFLGHANDAIDANDAWRRSGSPLINRPLSWLAKNAENDPNYTAFVTSLEPVRKEFMSFLNANRAEHEADLKTMQTVLNEESTPAQIEVALKQLGKSADIRLAAIGRKYQNTMGQPFPNLISDEGKKVLQRMAVGQPSQAQRRPVYQNDKIIGYTVDGKTMTPVAPVAQ